MDARSKISKLVWFHLNHHDTHRGHAGILLFECRSSPNFYKTAAYQKVRQYAGLFSSTIDEGMREGLFRTDLNIRLMRDIILGTLDAETISCLASREIDKSVPDLEDTVNIINTMLSRKPEAAIDKSDRILMAAESVFAQKGFTKAKVLDIAKAAQVSEGTVYEYYETKKGLLLSMACNRLKDSMDRLSEELKTEHPLQELRKLIRWYFTSFAKDREFLKIFLLDLQLKKDFYSSCAYRYFKNFTDSIEELVKKGMREDCFRPDINPRVFRNIVIGSFNHCALRWLIFGLNSKTDKMTEIEDLIDLLSFSIIKN
jgi:TetR/AcrR family fatty acid metabolism transcriptional regulator